jgi:hypothetical protein
MRTQKSVSSLELHMVPASVFWLISVGISSISTYGTNGKLCWYYSVLQIWREPHFPSKRGARPPFWMTSRGFFEKRVPRNLKKKVPANLEKWKISYTNTVIPTEIPTNEYQAIPTNEYRQYQPRGGGMIPIPEKWLVSTWYATLVSSQRQDLRGKWVLSCMQFVLHADLIQWALRKRNSLFKYRSPSPPSDWIQSFLQSEMTPQKRNPYQKMKKTLWKSLKRSF